MSCFKNKKKILGIIPIEGDHKFKITSISRFVNSSKHLIVDYQCSLCGARERSNFVETEELIRKGFSIETLDEITPSNTLFVGDNHF